MDNYRINRSNYNQRQGNSCSMPRQGTGYSMPRRNMTQAQPRCNTITPSIYQGLDTLPVGMGYVPFSHFGKPYELCKALEIGTIFPELNKPFCGKGGGGCK